MEGKLHKTYPSNQNLFALIISLKESIKNEHYKKCEEYGYKKGNVDVDIKIPALKQRCKLPRQIWASHCWENI